ncbi:hypothetical protein [uncultured Veillonella sp.]|uniref:hypothetical protein n=1 Tax=uncultured Veillonella sp. TaxID=159268 RepID=UPI0025F7440C|nr:hypothetical protein [uncultured Veillonella sp.]MDY3973901.1 hypothetical protein [Veillonella caviae]
MGQKRNTMLAIVAILIVVIIGGAAGGYWYYKRTPTYSLKLLGQSIKEHDWHSFDAHVDVEQVSEDIVTMVAMIGYSDRFTYLDHIDKHRIYLSPGFRETSKNVELAIEDTLRNKKIPSDDTSTPFEEALVGRIYKAFDFVEVLDVSRHGDEAIAQILLKQNKLNLNVIVMLEMVQLENGTWEVMSISNAEKIGEEFYEAAQEKLADMNKPTQEAIDEAVKIGDVKATLRRMGQTAYAPIYPYLQVNIPVTIGEQSISTIDGDIMFEGLGPNKNEVLRVPAVLQNTNIAMTNSTRTYYYSDRLSESSDEYEKLKEANMNNFNDVKVSFKIRRVVFGDGTELEVATKLSEADIF